MSYQAAYGLWEFVFVNSLAFITFAFSFTRSRTVRDWCSFGAFHETVLRVESYGAGISILLATALSTGMKDL